MIAVRADLTTSPRENSQISGTRLEEAERLIREIARFAGTSSEIDHCIWKKA